GQCINGIGPTKNTLRFGQNDTAVVHSDFNWFEGLLNDAREFRNRQLSFWTQCATRLDSHDNFAWGASQERSKAVADQLPHAHRVAGGIEEVCFVLGYRGFAASCCHGQHQHRPDYFIEYSQHWFSPLFAPSRAFEGPLFSSLWTPFARVRCTVRIVDTRFA